MFGVSYRPFRGVVSGSNRSSMARYFTAKYDRPAGELTTSRKAYPRDIPADAIVTVSVGAEYSLDGTTWTADPGVWGTSRFILCRGPSDVGYGAAKIHTVTIGLLELDFTIWTMADPTVLNATYLEDGTGWVMEDGTAILQEG